MLLTTKQIASFAMEPCLTREKVANLCREGKIFSWREEGKFGQWKIPYDSFAMYLLYNPVYKDAFMQMPEEEDPVMNVFQKAIRSVLNGTRNYNDQEYTFATLSDIFGIPENQIVAMLCPKKPTLLRRIYSIIGASGGVPAVTVLKFLHDNQDRLEALRERHKMLLANGDKREDAVRHLLMLYAYYESNGYLI